MRKYNNITDTSSIKHNASYEAEPLETKIAKVLQNNEPIDSSAPTIYTNRADGVQPAYDIRADRFDIAIDAMDKVSKSRLATRENYMKAEKGGANKGAETAANTSDNRPEAV